MRHAIKSGDRIGEFEIVRELARGGMGTVYVARQLTTGALRALKLLHPILGSDPRLQERFEQEARVGALVPSDHCVAVLGAGIDGPSGLAWLAMELLEGMDLGSYLASRHRLAAPEVLEILSQVAHALSAAHRAGIVHRDLKPENVYLATRRMVGVPYIVKVLDFGIAKLVSESTRATAALGTPAYMAPEQAHGSGAVSPAADVWAFGLLTFEMLTGISFWRGAAAGSPAELLREVLIDPIPLASERAAEALAAVDLPPELDAWIARTVARNPSDRFASIDEALAGLRVALGDSTVAPSTHLSMPDAVAMRTSSLDSTVPRVEGASLEGGGLGTPSHRGRSLAAVPAPGRASAPTPRRALRVVYRERFGRTIAPGEPGQTLLEISIANDVPHQRVCGGKARCTTCRVIVHDGAAQLEARTDPEAKVAVQRGWGPEIRLACQARLRADARGDIVVRRLVVDREDAADAQMATGEEERIAERVAVLLSVRLVGLGSFASRHLPYDAMHVTSRAFRSLSDLVRANHGELLAAHGATLVAAFGSRPDDLPRAAMDAARAAVRMQARMATINEYVGRNFGEAFSIAIGAHVGTVFTGSLADGEVRTPAVLGEAVEVAQAVAAHAEAARAPFAATDAVVETLGAQVTHGIVLPEVQVGARATPVRAIDGFAKPDVNFLVQTSFDVVTASGDEFARRFYERLFTIAPEVEPLFAHVEMDVQRKMLMDVLGIAVRGLDDLDRIVPKLRALGKRHFDYGVKTRHYRMVGEALMWSLEKHLGDGLTPELHVAWMEVYGTIARTMIDAARPPPAAVA